MPRLLSRAGGHRGHWSAPPGARRPRPIASPGKGKPRHITETRAPSRPPARAAPGEEEAAPPRERRGRGLRPSALAPRRGTPETEGKSPLALAFVPGAGARGAGPRQRRGRRGIAPARRRGGTATPARCAGPRTCTRARRQRRAALPCSSHSPWLKRPARQHRGRSRRPLLPAAGRRAWDSACRGGTGHGLIANYGRPLLAAIAQGEAHPSRPGRGRLPPGCRAAGGGFPLGRPRERREPRGRAARIHLPPPPPPPQARRGPRGPPWGL